MKRLITTTLLAFLITSTLLSIEKIDITNASVELNETTPLIRKAFEVMRDEIAKRTGIQMDENQLGSANALVIELGTEQYLKNKNATYSTLLSALQTTGKDGYKIVFSKANNRIIIAGHDPRGTFYGMGYILRKLEMRTNSILMPYSGDISSTPTSLIRGHMLQLNPKAPTITDSVYIAQFEQHVREWAIFGANGIEMLRSIPVQCVNICKSYGMDVWIITYNNFELTADFDKELYGREKIFRALPTIDNWVIKSGDPGDLPADVFTSFAKRESALLKKYHPNAKVWISPQRFTDAPAEYFDNIIQEINQSDWVNGVVYGPWSRYSMPDFRNKIRKDLPIRHFPDIGHNYSCQYPVKNLDLPLAMTYGRISINPSPIAQKYIHNLFDSLTVGSISYSEGTNDDVNKYVWLGQGWDSQMSVVETLQDYGRLFIGPDYAEDFSSGLLKLEQNVTGSLLSNNAIDATLEHWQKLENRMDTRAKSLIRFQMCLLRAYYDAYTRTRFIYETNLEKLALDKVKALSVQSSIANSDIDNVLAILSKAQKEPVALDLKRKCRELYSSVYVDEAANWTMENQKCVLIDQIDIPLNNKPWLDNKLGFVKNLSSNKERQNAMLEITNRTNPGISGFYYDLGSIATDSITLTTKNWLRDPYFLESPFRGFGASMSKFVINARDYDNNPIPTEWLTQASIYYDKPLELTFKNLESCSDYKIRVTYIGEVNKFESSVSLVANDSIKIHDAINITKANFQYTYEFDLPIDTYENGKIKLTWKCSKGERGAQVAEVFFIKK